MHHSDGKSLREELRLVERHGRGRPYPKDLRRRAAAFGVLRARQGAALHAIAQELGIADRTLARWLVAAYLAVILDLFSRYAVGWAVSAVNDRQRSRFGPVITVLRPERWPEVRSALLVACGFDTGVR